MFSPSHPHPAPPAPSQARSRDKLERVLLAAEGLLDEHLFEELTVAQIAERARVSVGTIYTRFRSKDELLPALFARHSAAVGGRVGALMGRLAADPLLSSRITRVVTFAVDYHVRHRGLLRALTMYARSNPTVATDELLIERAGQYRGVAEALVADGAGMRERAGETLVDSAEFALGLVNSVCREQVLFDDVTPLRGRQRSKAALKRRLAQTIHRDLTSRSN